MTTLRPFYSRLSSALRRAQASPRHVKPAQNLAQKRAFSNLPRLRPNLSPSSGRTTSLRAGSWGAWSPFQPQQQPQPPQQSAASADLVPKSAISAHPALAHVQIRCGPRPTMEVSSRLIRQRRHGFLSRIRTAKGRKLIARRRAKGRKRLGAC